MKLFNELNSIIKKFWLNEGQETAPDTAGYIQVVTELLSHIRPTSLRDQRYISVAKKHLNEIGKHVRKLTERVQMLEEEVSVLKEQKKKK